MARFWKLSLAAIACLVSILSACSSRQATTQPGPPQSTHGATSAGATPTPLPAWLRITSPLDRTSVDLSHPIEVTGEASRGVQANETVMVWVLDHQATILAEAEAPLKIIQSGGYGVWAASLEVHPQPGTRGIIYAFSSSPQARESGARDAVNVTFGPGKTGPYITINDPLPYTTLISPTFTVSGYAGALFEGALAVRAENAAGTQLTFQPANVDSPEAGTGGEGPWSVALSVNAPPNTPGRLVAYATSPKDGSIIATFSIPVTFGKPPAQIVTLEGTLWRLQSLGDPAKPQRPLPDTQITLTIDPEQGTVFGSAGCNQYSGVYHLEGEALSITALRMTEMACSPPVLQQEKSFLESLQNSQRLLIQNEELHITDSSGNLLIFVPIG